MCVRVGIADKYGFQDKYYIEIEGSCHKIAKGYNALNGFYNLSVILLKFINIVEDYYKIKLPSLKHWFLQRVDITKCFDLEDNQKVRDYINNLSKCNYPRRNLKHYQDESIYLSGTTTTLKIYNKLLEFKKHDYKKLAQNGFNVYNFSNLIDGFIRFECEIKKKKLQSVYNKKYIRVRNVMYKDLEEIWKEEFMKLIKMFENDLKKVYKKNDVENRLHLLYKTNLANILYNFYIAICSDGLEDVKRRTSKSTYYRNIKLLKEANIDFSQRFSVDLDDLHIDFNPFDYLEVV